NIADNAKVWFEDYRAYTLSARGLVNILQQFSGDIVSSAMEQLKNTSHQEGIDKVLEIADKWGMNNSPDEGVFE
ncbi:MAG TPA: hypothetical protein DCW90_06520, partial [Lachnospiraceae bacterium]|nr:hypothetical protein [Lachnospiraceae bacterium]